VVVSNHDPYSDSIEFWLTPTYVTPITEQFQHFVSELNLEEATEGGK
jgi:hypothetical protein